MLSSRRLVALFASAMLLATLACNDDDNNPVATNRTPAPTMANIWPNEDGNAWTFDAQYAEYFDEVIPASGDPDFPGIPAMSELHTDLQQPLSGVPDAAADGIFRIALNGIVVTDADIPAQNFEQTFYTAVPLKHRGQQPALAENTDHIMLQVARTRPDLRAEILTRLGLDEKVLNTMPRPNFLGGYAFAAEDRGYYSYGDLDANHSWIYLEESLAVGTEFSMQLIPAIADDIWLHGQIWSRGTIEVGGRTFRNVIECMYAIDLGTWTATDENGDEVGTGYGYIYGTNHYAPEIGPIRGRERQRNFGNDLILGATPAIMDFAFDLVGATALD